VLTIVGWYSTCRLTVPEVELMCCNTDAVKEWFIDLSKSVTLCTTRLNLHNPSNLPTWGNYVFCMNLITAFILIYNISFTD